MPRTRSTALKVRWEATITGTSRPSAGKRIDRLYRDTFDGRTLLGGIVVADRGNLNAVLAAETGQPDALVGGADDGERGQVLPGEGGPSRGKRAAKVFHAGKLI